MPTIPDLPPRRPSTEPARRRTLAAWPFALLALLLTLALLRAFEASGERSHATATPHSPTLVERRAGDLRIALPREWVTLEHDDTHVTFGETDRMHTVTLGSTEASSLPLPGVVRAMLEQTTRELPGARAVEEPLAIDPGAHAARGDAAMLARFRVGSEQPGGLELAQVWRRDSRAGLDLVATWTSADGAWPVSPRESIPRADAAM
jgi:hypothetical protein